jgi:uncharacterized protein (TIGR03382 family)
VAGDDSDGTDDEVELGNADHDDEAELGGCSASGAGASATLAGLVIGIAYLRRRRPRG